MSIRRNNIDFGHGFNVKAGSPIDSRFRVEYLSDLTTVFTGSEHPAYSGMIVAVLEDNHVYRLKGDISDKEAAVSSGNVDNWEQITDKTLLDRVAFTASVNLSEYSASASKQFTDYSASTVVVLSSYSQSNYNFISKSLYNNSASVANWISDTRSKFNGTASYSSDGPYLHISGGTVTGDVKFLHSFEEGYQVTASTKYSHAEGYQTYASGNYSHTEGGNTVASGQISHAEGNSTVASGEYSHAEGFYTKAVGLGSHAEGNSTVALENYSHAEGIISTASAEGQTVVGRYNEPSDKYAFIVGTGTGSFQSESAETTPIYRNAFAVNWNGDIDMLSGCVLNGTASYALNALASGGVSEIATMLQSGSCSISVERDSEGNEEIVFIVN